MRVVAEENRGERNDVISQTWVQTLETLGAIPIMLPNTLAQINDLIELVDLVILTGGNDITVNPFGGVKGPREDSAEDRDLQEYKIIDMCLARNIPLLGVCRGMQLINYWFGGSLVTVEERKHVRSFHDIAVEKSQNGHFLNGTWRVNSFHHFGITRDTLGSELEVVALADDSVIEAFCHQSLPICGIMWHPERNAVLSAIDRHLLLNLINHRPDKK